ncbi:MAG: type II secretion system F family protein [Candidatus Omnitrophica bacterium]|nr:type II secretion system F family protein [Candidatus Omnitrophota bacterium]
MPRFFYHALEKNGQKVTSFEEAADQDEIVARLQARGLTVINVMTEYKIGQKSFFDGSNVKRRYRRFHISSGDLTVFCRQLATLLGAGVTILKSLDIISKQVASKRFYNVLVDMQKLMEQGLSLHESMGKHPKVFSELWINLVESGEAGGNLAVVLSRLASYLERSEAFKRKVISALIYPIILSVAGLGALLFLTLKIIPTFAEIYSGFNITLPLLTRMLIFVSDFLKKYALVIVGGGLLGFYLFRKYTSTKIGRIKFEQFKFKLPMFGEFVRALMVERFSSNMATLLESGVPILYSLEITEHSVGNLVMGNIIQKIKEDVRDGKPLSQPLEKSGFFEPMVVQMLHIGEEIGELPQMFKKINDFYQEYIETFLTRFASIFEPAILVVMGFAIGILVIGMFLPIFQIAQIGG